MMEITAAQAAAELERRRGATQIEAGRGVARGAFGLATLPSLLGGLLDRGTERAGLVPEGTTAELQEQSPISSTNLNRAFDQATSGAFRRPENETTIDRFAGTVGEFIGPGVGGLGGRGLSKFAVAPGVTSEAAGTLTEGTALETPARILGGLLGGAVVPSGRPVQFDNVAGIDPEMARLANVLEQNGVRPTVGQASGSDLLRTLEGTAQPTGGQLDDLTAAALRTTGSNAPRATQEAIDRTRTRITDRMDSAVSGVDIVPTVAMGEQAQKILDAYNLSVTAAGRANNVSAIASKIQDLATTPNGAGRVSLDQLKRWRTELGGMLTSSDPATRQAAHGFRDIIDNATDQALTAAGRTDDLAALAQSRVEFRNILAIGDASTRAGAEAGRLTAPNLNQAVVRTQGRNAVATGRGTTELEALSRAGAGVLRPQAAVNPGGVRSQQGVLTTGLGIGGGLAGAPLGPVGAIAGAAAGAAVPALGRACATRAARWTLAQGQGLAFRLVNPPEICSL